MTEPRGPGRAGRYVRQQTGYAAYIPAALPPRPPIDLATLAPILSAADLAIGRLDGVSRTLPNPDLFVAMYVRREAVLSSQIEGTQSTLEDVLAYEAKAGAAIENAVIQIINTKIKSLAAGKMGYGTKEVGDMVAAAL